MSEWSYVPSKAELIPNMLFQHAKQQRGKPVYYTNEGGGYQPTLWEDYIAEIEMAARALIALKLDEQETLGIIGFNRPEWTGLATAAMVIRAVPVGLYTTLSVKDLDYTIGHAQIQIVLVETLAQYEKIVSIRSDQPQLKHIVFMKTVAESDIPQADGVMSWAQFLALGEGVDIDQVHARRDRVSAEDLATLIYTSGTTGTPKGVMLPHRAIATAAWSLKTMLDLKPTDRFLSYLPLSHIVEQIISIFGPAYIGFEIFFAQSMDDLADNIKQCEPTIFFGVPRVWEKFYEGVSQKLGAATGVKKLIAKFAQSTARKYHDLLQAGKAPGAVLKLQYKICDKLVYAKLRQALGFAKARYQCSGAAPLSRHIIDFFADLDLIVNEVYGQTEDAGPCNFNLPGAVKFGSVGRSVPGVDIKIADDGEILVNGATLFTGYYRNNEATAETFTSDGWLKSGDLGHIDEDGFLFITGRKKDIIITAGGKNISPRKIEEAVEAIPVIEHCVVEGDRRKFLSALVTINQEVAQNWAKENDMSKADLINDQTFKQEVANAINRVNQDLARVEQIKAHRILPKNFTIDGGELTPTLKIKRKAVLEKYAKEIELIYE